MIVGDDADALERACTAVSERPDALAAFGGDGLVHLAVQAVAGTDALGIILAGIGNDIASALGLHRADPSPPPGPCCGCGPGRWTPRTSARERPRNCSPGVVCCGFDSRVNERANRLTWPPGMARYLVAMAGELRCSGRSRSGSRSTATRWSSGEAMLVAVANTHSYGAGCASAPTRAPTTGWLTWR